VNLIEKRKHLDLIDMDNEDKVEETCQNKQLFFQHNEILLKKPRKGLDTYSDISAIILANTKENNKKDKKDEERKKLR
jgi:hypothetical protein